MRIAFFRAVLGPAPDDIDLRVSEGERTRKVTTRTVRGDRPGRHGTRRGVCSHFSSARLGRRVVVQVDTGDASFLMTLKTVVLKDGCDVIVVSQRRAGFSGRLAGIVAAAAG